MWKRKDRIMHNRLFIPRLVLACGFLALSGCNDHQETRTIIHLDGTCERTIVVENDGTDHWPRGPFPLPVPGTGWDTVRIASDTAHKEKRWSYTRTFPSLQALQEEYRPTGDSSHFGVRVSIERHFRWFYTYFTYREIYCKFTHDTLVDPHVVLSDDEIRRYSDGDTSQTLKRKIEEWNTRNLFEMIIRRLARDAQSFHDSSLAEVMLDEHKEEFFRVLGGKDFPDSLRDHSSFRGTKTKMFTEDGGLSTDGIEALTEIGVRTFQTASFRKLKTSLNPAFTEAVQHWLTDPKGDEASGNYGNSIVLPGVLLETNAPDVKGNEASWHLDVRQLQLRDYEMHAESRTVNLWAFVVSGLLGIGLIGWLAVSGTGRHYMSRPSWRSFPRIAVRSYGFRK